MTLSKTEHAGQHPPHLGIDLDGTIDEAPAFFAALSHCWPGKVFVITFRDDAAKARADVERHGVRFDELVLVNTFAQKAEVIKERDIGVYFDDQDEILLHIPEGVTILKIRNGGNYDFDSQQWLYSNLTGRQV
ncbi:hypothetical protein [Tautonia marina]|uniref:hypothetical protein n=1 Tax=Tautonia marina TaxID=2653855 RepID=UPI00126081BF|nr:hypothetical protein [Tautonia marina]